MRSAIVPLLILLTPQSGMAADLFDPPIGTYKTLTVKDFDACDTVCNDDNICRGYQAVQPDIDEQVICFLNDGLSEGSDFEVKPPEPPDFSVILSEFNDYRAQYGLMPVVYNDKLQAASKRHADDMAVNSFLAHYGSDGSSPGDRVQEASYYPSIAAENAAAGQISWAQVFKGWKNSEGHNDNLLRNDVSDFGIAVAYNPQSEDLYYWAMIVASPLDEDLSPFIYPDPG